MHAVLWGHSQVRCRNLVEDALLALDMETASFLPDEQTPIKVSQLGTIVITLDASKFVS